MDRNYLRILKLNHYRGVRVPAGKARVMSTIELSQEGNMVCALVGPDLQEGIGGFGRTVPDSLRDLARMIERTLFPVPGFETQRTEAGVCRIIELGVPEN